MILGSFRGPKSMQNEVRKRLGNRIVNKRAQDRQKTAPRRRKTPQGLQVEPTWIQEGSQNQSKIDQNSILGAQGSSKATEDPPETPDRPQIDPKSTPNWFTIDAKLECKRLLKSMYFHAFRHKLWQLGQKLSYTKLLSWAELSCATLRSTKLSEADLSNAKN